MAVQRYFLSLQVAFHIKPPVIPVGAVTEIASGTQPICPALIDFNVAGAMAQPVLIAHTATRKINLRVLIMQSSVFRLVF
jgi:hypothetical protein